MRTFVLILTLAAFLQTSIFPVNLVLILLVSRSFLVDERTNYFLSFFIGVFLGILTPINIGFWPIVLLMVVKIIQLVKKLPIFGSAKTFLPVAASVIILVKFLESLSLNQSVNWIIVLIEILLSLLIFWVVKFWEERFIVRADIKLKMKS